MLRFDRNGYSKKRYLTRLYTFQVIGVLENQLCAFLLCVEKEAEVPTLQSRRPWNHNGSCTASLCERMILIPKYSVPSRIPRLASSLDAGHVFNVCVLLIRLPVLADTGTVSASKKRKSISDEDDSDFVPERDDDSVTVTEESSSSAEESDDSGVDSRIGKSPKDGPRSTSGPTASTKQENGRGRGRGRGQGRGRSGGNGGDTGTPKGLPPPGQRIAYKVEESNGKVGGDVCVRVWSPMFFSRPTLTCQYNRQRARSAMPRSRKRR